jgi:hypothetical protein
MVILYFIFCIILDLFVGGFLYCRVMKLSHLEKANLIYILFSLFYNGLLFDSLRDGYGWDENHLLNL